MYLQGHRPRAGVDSRSALVNFFGQRHAPSVVREILRERISRLSDPITMAPYSTVGVLSRQIESCPGWGNGHYTRASIPYLEVE